MYFNNVKPRMSLGEALTSVFKNYANFTGRARRSEYWWFMFFYGAIDLIFNLASLGFIAKIMSGEMLNNDPTYLTFLMMSVIVGLGFFLPYLSVTVRRLHDIGKSGWNILLPIIPLVGIFLIILLIVWMCRDSDVEANKYGESPKYSN